MDNTLPKKSENLVVIIGTLLFFGLGAVIGFLIL
jgi:hypothetical protein